MFLIDIRIDLVESKIEQLDQFVHKAVSDNPNPGIANPDISDLALVEVKLTDLENTQKSNKWNLESLADQVDRLDERRNVNEYLRADMSNLKEQQNLQEIKQLMMTQELKRIITHQDQKV